VKGVGYLISILSVFLLAAGSLKTASKDPLLLICLIAGMTSSIVGMALRYADYRREQREKQA
jgi:multisubunit Na+/H+ antiporter MnhG subunit